MGQLIHHAWGPELTTIRSPLNSPKEGLSLHTCFAKPWWEVRLILHHALSVLLYLKPLIAFQNELSEMQGEVQEIIVARSAENKCRKVSIQETKLIFSRNTANINNIRAHVLARILSFSLIARRGKFRTSTFTFASRKDQLPTFTRQLTSSN